MKILQEKAGRWWQEGKYVSFYMNGLCIMNIRYNFDNDLFSLEHHKFKNETILRRMRKWYE